MQEDLISVIIPVYNVEKYINRCVDSVIHQSYTNLEIILVDDGSPDNCPTICDNYSKQDSRIKVIHKKNGGLSDARNVGIDASNGKYITFVDSDDWIPQNSIMTLYNNIKINDADISSGTIMETYKKNINKKIVSGNRKTYNTEQAMEELLYLHRFSNSASGKLYKKTLFNNIRYPLGKHYEDLATTYKVFDLAKKVVGTDEIVYFYFQNSNSIMHKKYDRRRLESYEFAKKQLQFIKKEYPKITKAAIFRLFYEILMILYDMPLFSEDKKIIMHDFQKYRRTCIKNNKLYKKQKMLCFSSYFGHIGIKIVIFLKKYIKKVYN